MRESGAFEAKNRFGTLLDWVEKGEEIIITRRGKAVARLVPSTVGFDCGKATQAVNDILARRVGVTLGGLKIKDLVNESRRPAQANQRGYRACRALRVALKPT